MPHMMELEANNNNLLEAKYREYRNLSEEQIKQATNEVSRLTKNKMPDDLMNFLESEECPKHPIFLNDRLRNIILTESFTSEQKLEFVRIFLQNQDFLDFIQQFPQEVSGPSQVVTYIVYEPASQAALSDPAILELFIDIDNGQAVVKGCLEKAAEDNQIDALKLILDKCTTPDEIETIYNSLLEKHEEKQQQAFKLRHMQRFINNNLERMVKPYFTTIDHKPRGVDYAIYASVEDYHAQDLIFEKRFAEAEQYLLKQKNKPNSPWSKYEYVYMFVFQSIVANSISEETEDLLAFIRFLFADPKFVALFQAHDFREPIIQMIINNSMQLVPLLIELDNGKTVVKLDLFREAIMYVNVPLFEMLMQNPTIVAAVRKDAVLRWLDKELQCYDGDLELRKQVLDLLDTKHKELLANESTFNSVKRRDAKAANRMLAL